MAVMVVAPLAVLPVTPFLAGLRVAQHVDGASIRCGDGKCNAATSTLGTLLCVTASVKWVLTRSLLAACTRYLGAFAVWNSAARAVCT